MDRQTLSITQVEKFAGVSRRTVYNWMAEGKVEYVRTASGRVRVFADSIWRKADRTRMTQEEVDTRFI